MTGWTPTRALWFAGGMAALLLALLGVVLPLWGEGEPAVKLGVWFAF